MARSPRPPYPLSTSPSFASRPSVESSEDEEGTNQSRGCVTSPEIKKLFDQFESAPTFSQLNQRGGRGTRIVSLHLGLLTHIWSNRDPNVPNLCFDKHDQRHGLAIYTPPRRTAGGVVLPCTLATHGENETNFQRTVNVINNNITLNTIANALSSAPPPQEPRSVAVETVDRAGGRTSIHPATKKRKLQLTFAAPKKNPLPRSLGHPKGGNGRFIRKALAPVSEMRATAPAVPLSTRGLRRLLRQWVQGDAERGLETPLSKFSSDQRNGKDAVGKSNKHIYSKRKTVAVATLLALQDAVENQKTFAEAIGVDHMRDLEAITMTQWEHICKKYLGKNARKLPSDEIIRLGEKLYRDEVLELLPPGDL